MDFYSLIPIYVNIIHVRMNKVIFILYPLMFLIANVCTSAIKKRHDGFKGNWGYRGTLSDITKDTVFVQ